MQTNAKHTAGMGVYEIAGRNETLPVVRRLFVDAIVREMVRDGKDVTDLLSRHGLSDGPAGSPYAMIPLRAYVGFFEDAANLLERPYLGLEMGQAFRAWEVGPVYSLLATAQTLRGALDVFARFQRLWQSHTTMSCKRQEEQSIYIYMIDDLSVWPRRQDAEYAIAGLCGMVRQLLSDRWNPVEVRFEHDVSDHADALRRFFKCRITGNASANGMVLLEADLERPLSNWLRFNEAARQIVESHLFDLLGAPEERHRSLPERVALIVARRLGREAIDLKSVCDELAVSPRTIRRQLSAHETSFRKIVNDERMKKARNLMSGGTITIEQMAEHLGYGNQAAFSRAFRSLTGESPSAARKAARRQSSHT
ncbi:AraC family transcriptional regulator [Martelella soudanensis]|uniref:AraC family transcriptional regulator n=1 Tax=unclassified Martelella TaxID=2629616 RepID=UPI0015DE1103|nr:MULTISPECIES: AraC family transcriptional regulator [unclassified Martelella]